MLRLLLFTLIFCCHNFICQATPLLGDNVRAALQNEFPFIVSISFSPTSKFAKTEEQSHQCTGSLITTTHVLTAAHCIDEFEEYPFDFIVKVGSVDWRNATTYEVDSWTTYGDWAKDNVNVDAYYDVAIITLKSSVSSNIPLATLTREKNNKLYDRTAFTAGWGILEDKKTPRYLRTAELKVLEPGKCPFGIINLPATIKDLVPQIYFCTKAEPPVKITCGDSGGPLLINKKEIIAITGNCWPDAEVPMSEYRNMHPAINFYKEFIMSVTKNRAKIAKRRCIIQ